MAEYDVMGNYTGFDDSYNTGYPVEPVSPQAPVSYDPFGNPVYNEEEERRKREEEARQIEEYKKQQEALGSEVTHKQEVTTYADGSKTEKTTKEIPAGGQQRIQPVAPQSPEQARYNQYIQQQESGARPDIGYHNQQLSSAYGPYGITAGAYEDARRANPNLPEDIRQATPEQMTAAQNQVTANNSRYLQSYGVPVNEGTLGAAHFLGAKGLSDYLKTGYISPQAAQANGGVERVKQIVEKRLQGQAAPASGAAQMQPQRQRVEPVAPQAQPAAQVETPMGTREPATQAQAPRMAPNSFDDFGTPVYSPDQAQLDQQLKTFESIQNDPKALMNFEGPDWMKERAKARAADILSDERDKQKALESIQKSDPKDLARTMMREPTDRWEIIKKSAMFRLLGANELADKELGKISTPVEKYVQGADGKPYLVKQNASGEIVEGYNAETGKKLTDNEIVKVGAGIGQGKWQTSAEFFQDKAGNVFQAQHNDKGQTRMVDVKTGAQYSGEGKLERLRDVSGRAATEQKQEYRRENDLNQFARNIASMDYKGKLAAVADARQAAINRGEPDFTDQELANLGVTRPTLNLYSQTGQVSGGGQAPAAPAAPAAAQAAPQTARPTAPVVPTAGTAPAPVVPTTRMSVEEMKRQEAQQKLQREAASQVSVDQQKRFNEYVEKDIQPKADAGKLISRVRKEQINGPDGILNNPEIAGMLQGGQGSEVGNILRDLITGNFKDQADLSSRVAQLNLTPRQKEVLYTQIGLNNQILPQTLKANAGPGAISEAEHKINREANVDITRQPLYSGLSLMTRDQFQKDLAVAKNDFRSNNPDIRTTDDLNKAWSKQERAANEAYDRIYAARAAYIAKHNPDGTKPGVAVDAFRHYPVPSWNGTSWDYGTEYAKKAARPPLGSFNR